MAVAYDYALVRVVPHVPMGDAETVGVVLQSRQARFLDVRFTAAPEALVERWPALDGALLARYLRAFHAVVAGGPSAAPVGLLPPSERFHWLTAPRSTVLQTSAVHTGLTEDPAETLEAVARALRRPGAAGRTA